MPEIQCYQHMTRGVTRMFYTVGTAAKATGKSKPTISRAIKNGQISAMKEVDGSYRIDPAELHRVFQPVTHDGNANGDKTHEETLGNAGTLQGAVEVLRELVAQVKEERDDLRRRLDNAEAARQREAEAREQAAAEIRRLTLMITHQPQPTAEPAPAPEAEAPPAPTPEPQAPANQNPQPQQQAASGKGEFWGNFWGIVAVGGAVFVTALVLGHYGLLPR